MRAYKVVRRSGTGEAPEESIRIWDGENLLWERDADSFVDREGQMVKLSALTDLEIIELYRKAHE
jgi:hypothetical protein